MPKSTAKVNTGSRKRSSTHGQGPPDEPELQSRKDTLHMENQERAYVAASRRTDRSLEARYQSARMASEVHQRRTGKGLRVTHQIVRDEEMYEEEDLGLPSWRRAPRRSGKVMSETDAYVAALIARKAGVHNVFENNYALFAPQAIDAAWTVQTPPASAGINSSSVSQRSAEDCAGHNPACAPEYEADAAFTLPGPVEADFDVLSFPAFATFPDPTPHLFSHGSSTSDMSSNDSSYIFTPEDQDSSRESSGLWLQDCLVETDEERILQFAQNGLMTEYD